MSLLRHSILRQSLLRHLLLRQSLLRLLILRQWPIVFFSIYHQNICSYLGPIDAYVLPSRSIFLTVCFETFWLVDSCLSLGMLFKICCKAPYQEDIRFSYNFLDCVYASFNKGKVSKVSNKKFPYFRAI